MKQKTITIIFFTSIILFGINVSSASAATYFMRADGTATSKTQATGPATDKTKCMNVATHNVQTFLPGDIIALSSLGGRFESSLFPRSSGDAKDYITYDGDFNDTGNNAEFGKEASIPGWDNSQNWTDEGGNVWSLNVSIYPQRVWIDGAEALQAKNAPNANEKWSWNDQEKKIYVYCTGNPVSTYASFTFPEQYNPIWVQGRDYITFRNLNVVYFRGYGFGLSGCDNLIIEDCAIGFNSGGNGIFASHNSPVKGTSSHGIIRNCIFDTNYVLKYTWKLEGGINDAILIRNGTNNWEVYGNYIKNWGHAGIYLMVDTVGYSVNDNKIYGNIITAPDIQYGRGIGADAPSGGAKGNEIHGNAILDTATRNQINMPGLRFYNNIIRKVRGNRQFGFDYGQGLSLEGYGIEVAEDMQIYNNVISECDSYGLVFYPFGNEIRNNAIRNNIIINNGGSTTNYQLYLTDHNLILGNVFKNNIFYKNGVEELVYYGHDSADDYPHTVSEFNDESGNAGDVIGGNINGDPLFTNSSGAFSQSSDFKLSSSSPAIDAGTDVGLTSDFEGTPVPQGTAPDIGAFEYSSGTPQYRPADINQDAHVNVIDLGILMSDFGKSAAQAVNPLSDINTDGSVNVIDLGILMSEWE